MFGEYNFTYNNCVLNIVNEFNYLGVIFSRTGAFLSCQRSLTGQSRKTLFQLNVNISSYSNLKTNHVNRFFDKLITPILLYESEI